MSITLPSFFETFIQPRFQTTWYQYPIQDQVYSAEYFNQVSGTSYQVHRQSATDPLALSYYCPSYVQYPQQPVYYSHTFIHPNLYKPYQVPESRMKRLRTIENLQEISSNHVLSKSKNMVEVPDVPEKKVKKASFIVKPKEMKAFFGLLADELIQDFFEADSCVKISDKYLLAMVFAYFKRACFSIREYTRTNFFVALYLANDVEEDDEDLKYEIFPWALGRRWKDKYPQFLLRRDRLFKRIGYRAIVSRRCCDEIMALTPKNLYWSRERPIHHAGAIRNYMREPDDDGYPRGPGASPRVCRDCDITDSQYDSASPSDSTVWYISSHESTPSQTYSGKPLHHSTSDIFFNMQGLKQNLPESSKHNNADIFSTGTNNMEE